MQWSCKHKLIMHVGNDAFEGQNTNDADKRVHSSDATAHMLK